MSALKYLQSASSLGDVAHLLGFKPSALAYIIRMTPATSRYTQFSIPKRSGGKRIICAPNERLKLLQKRLAEHLMSCEMEIEIKRCVKQRLAHGFKKGQSILTNANVHRGRRYVLNIDIKDFFDTINFGRVRGYFIKNHDFCLKPDVATVLAQIACHNNALPQGAPCSPVISNLISNILDIRLAKLAKDNGCSYTRYADDITFSTSLKDFPGALAEQVSDSPHEWVAGKKLSRIVNSCGFSINPKKTRLQYRRGRQEVTGLVVNNLIGARTEYRRLLRAFVHRFCSTGAYELPRLELTATGDVELVTRPGSAPSLEGMLNFVRFVERWRLRDREQSVQGLTATEKLLRQFLFYKQFANASQAAILFEGKTDYLYVREALRALANLYPTLAATNSSPPKLHVTLHKNTDTMGALFGLTGGGDTLKRFVETYKKTFWSFKGPKGLHPVVVVADNDSGFKELKHLIAGKFKASLTPGKQFFHVVENLYVLLTSPLNELPQSHCIENCFDASTLALQLSGKTFNPSKDFDPEKQYGKAWFAEKVVKPNAATIDFSGFIPMLNALADLVATHASKSLSPGTIAPTNPTVPTSA